MEEIISKINEVVATYEGTIPRGRNKKERELSFSPVAQKIRELRWLAAEKAPYLQENIDRIEDHYGAVFKIRETNGHSAEQHLLWVDSAIRGIKRELNMVKKLNTPPERG